MLASKGITIPKKTSLYKYRISIDLATILWARRHRFGLDRPFYVHCRLDASLQYGKDYFMSEADIVYPEGINSWQDVSREGTLYTRVAGGSNFGSARFWSSREDQEALTPAGSGAMPRL